MADKHAIYDNPAGYGHGGLGYNISLDALPEGPPPRGQLPAWVPWVGLAGAGLLGVAGLRGLGKLFRRAPRTAKPIHWPVENEMLGRVSPTVERAIEESTANLAARGIKVSSVIPALGRIAQGE